MRPTGLMALACAAVLTVACNGNGRNDASPTTAALGHTARRLRGMRPRPPQRDHGRCRRPKIEQQPQSSAVFVDTWLCLNRELATSPPHLPRV